MRIGNVYQNGNPVMVVETKSGLLDVQKSAEEFKIKAPDSVKQLIESGSQGLATLKTIVETAEEKNSGVYLSQKDAIEWGPVISDPEKILCVGLNYRRHAEETGNSIPTRPILFSKFNNSLAGNNAKVVRPSVVKEMDYEAELAIIIGKEAHCVSESDALSYVFGYTVANDISARDLQNATSQWLIGKTCDNFAPIGPFVVTADAVANPDNLRISCIRNGSVVQDSNTADMIFSCSQIICYASSLFTLKPGDIILTGTPEGVIMGFQPEKQTWLKDGDEVVTTIEGIGELKYTVVAENR